MQPKLVYDMDYSMCYNATSTLRLYILLPGKKIFISSYHPFKGLESMVIAGGHYFRISINARQIEMVPEGNDCLNIDKNMAAVFESYDRYENWYTFLKDLNIFHLNTCSVIENMLQFSKKWNHTPYHPFLDNYPQYQHHLEGQQEPFNNSDISFIYSKDSI